MAHNARRKEVFTAAARVFRRKGYHAARIQDVADELGMQKGSLYYYISSKSDLLRGLVEGPMRQLADDARAVLATGHPPADKLARLIELHLRLFQSHRDTFGVFLREDLDLLDRSADDDLRDLARSYEATWEALLDEGIARGDFDPALEKRIVIKAIVGMCNGTYIWFRPEGRYPIEEVARLFARFALHGVTPRPG